MQRIGLMRGDVAEACGRQDASHLARRDPRPFEVLEDRDCETVASGQRQGVNVGDLIDVEAREDIDQQIVSPRDLRAETVAVGRDGLFCAPRAELDD